MATAVFQLEPLSRFSNLRSIIRQPQVLSQLPRARLNYDDQHKLKLDASSLRYYYNPELDTDLSSGFETFIKHDDSIDGHLNGLLEAIVDLEQRTRKKCTADVVTWRGMMTKIMSLPYNMRNGFEMNATKFQGTIYIEENHEYRMASRGESSCLQDTMSFWGYKFETLATLPATWDECSRDTIEARPKEVVSNEAQFCSIVKTGLGDTRLILGGEVDAVWDQRIPSDPPINYVELKTSKEITCVRDEVAFERKLQRVWSQSFLLGVGRIIVGFRDDDGVLRSVKEFDTQAIPTIAKRSGRNLWDGKFSIDFTASVLEWILETIVDDGVWLIRHRENSSVIEVLKTDSPSFLSSSFVKWRSENSIA